MNGAGGATTSVPQVLLLPGWENSGPRHWQSRWEHLYNYPRVGGAAAGFDDQAYWFAPRLIDWITALEQAVARAAAPVVLVAHSLACHQVAHWARQTAHAGKVKGALLVAPPDIEMPRWDQAPFISFRPIPRQRLPFASIVLAATNDPFGSQIRARDMAADWGSQFIGVGLMGHINSDSGLGDWAAGHELLAQFK